MNIFMALIGGLGVLVFQKGILEPLAAYWGRSAYRRFRSEIGAGLDKLDSALADRLAETLDNAILPLPLLPPEIEIIKQEILKEFDLSIALEKALGGQK